MILSDLIYNDNLELNTDYKIYRQNNLVYKSTPVYHKPKDELLDADVAALSVKNNTLIITIH